MSEPFPADWAIQRALERSGQDHVYSVKMVHQLPLRFAVLLLLAEALEALAFYADRDNWRVPGTYRCGHGFPSPAEIDRGNKAGAVLAANGASK